MHTSYGFTNSRVILPAILTMHIRWKSVSGHITLLQVYFMLTATLYRLLTGHTHLTHSYLLNKEQPPNCNYCQSFNSRTHPNFMFSHILTNISKQHILNYLSEINILTNFNFLYGMIRPELLIHCVLSVMRTKHTVQHWYTLLPVWVFHQPTWNSSDLLTYFSTYSLYNQPCL